MKFSSSGVNNWNASASFNSALEEKLMAPIRALYVILRQLRPSGYFWLSHSARVTLDCNNANHITNFAIFKKVKVTL